MDAACGKFKKKILINNLILNKNWMLTTCCTARVLFFCLFGKINE